MGSKLCPKILLEGTRLTLKTEIAFALNEHPKIVGARAYRYHSPIISAERCGFTNHPWGRGLINFEPHEEALAMETYQTWVRLFELLRYYSWISDRFHISTRAYQIQTYGIDHDFTWLEERLVDLGFHLIFCIREPRTLPTARVERLRVSGKPAQYNDLEVFIHEQELMRKLVNESKLPMLEVYVSDNDVDQVVDQIAEWMEKTGGLWAE